MTARERHIEKIERTKEEIKRSNQNGVHMKDLKRKLAKLQRELLEYDRLFRKVKQF